MTKKGVNSVLQKALSIFKRAFVTLCGIFVILLILNLSLYNIPKYTPVKVSLEAVKLDEYGNELGTFPITINGYLKEYLFRSDSLDVKISPLDGLTDFEPVEQLNDHVFGAIHDWKWSDWRSTFYTANGVGYFYHVDMYFDPNFDHWLFSPRGYLHSNFEQKKEKYYYIASTNEEYSLEDIKEYFKQILVFKELPTDD